MNRIFIRKHVVSIAVVFFVLILAPSNQALKILLKSLLNSTAQQWIQLSAHVGVDNPKSLTFQSHFMC